MHQNRRSFLKYTSQSLLGLGLLGLYNCGNSGNDHAHEHGGEGHIHDHEHTNGNDHQHEHDAQNDLLNNPDWFKISLAQWSLNEALFGKEIDNLNFAATAKNKYGFEGVEYVNQFFADKAQDTKYLGEMKKRAEGNGVESLLIMIDNEGDLGDLDDKARKTAVENHYKWLEAAKFLGCHSIRVNAFGEGTMEEVGKAAVNGLGMLTEKAATMDLNVLVENHGSYSSNGEWLSGVMAEVNHTNCGTLPDFGNFCVKKSGPGFWEGDCLEEYERYRGVKELMPYAKSVSAKSYDFDEAGFETTTDFLKMMKIVKNAGYRGWVGVEYEGKKLSPHDGIIKTKALLEKVRAALL